MIPRDEGCVASIFPECGIIANLVVIFEQHGFSVSEVYVMRTSPIVRDRLKPNDLVYCL